MGRAGVRAGAGRAGAHCPAVRRRPTTPSAADVGAAGCPCAAASPGVAAARRSSAAGRVRPGRLQRRALLSRSRATSRSSSRRPTCITCESPDLVSLPSQNVWKPYNEAAEQIIIGDHKRLWATNFLDDLEIEAVDFPFSNGVIGKVIVYNMEERQRIKNTVYNEGTKEIEQAKVEERLRELGITIRLDSFVDQATEKKVANVIREMMVEKGFQEAKVEPYHEALPGGPKSVALKFKVTEGPKIKISNVDFVGNKVFSDGKLAGKMKTNKGGGFWIFPGSSVYQEDKFEEDAEAVVGVLPRAGLPPVQRRPAQPQAASRLEGRQRAVHDARDSDQRGTALPRRQVRVRRQRQGARRRHAAALQDEDRRLLQREADPRRLPEDPGNLRRRRPLRDDAVPGVRARGRQGQRHDPDQRRQAVLRQPHHVPGQHDDARQRHPARDAALREQRLQHRGAQVQRQAAEPARLFQAARRSEEHHHRQDAGRRQQGRSSR